MYDKAIVTILIILGA